MVLSFAFESLSVDEQNRWGKSKVFNLGNSIYFLILFYQKHEKTHMNQSKVFANRFLHMRVPVPRRVSLLSVWSPYGKIHSWSKNF